MTTYCFTCKVKDPPHDVVTGICERCGSEVEEVEWDDKDQVWVPVPPGEPLD